MSSSLCRSCQVTRGGIQRLNQIRYYTNLKDEKLKDIRDRIIRVDHAGEFGANRIYAGQMAVLGT